MLPSSGYFQSVICPFFNSGLCERPHCHFRHVKKETFGKSTFNTLIDESLIRNAREDGREPDILEMVDNAIKQAERDVERNKAVLEATGALSSKQYESAAPVIYIPTPKSSSVPTSRSVSHVEPKISKSSSIPQYHPTPISKLKKLQKQYDPVNNFSTPVQPAKRKKRSEYKISEAKYIISGKESSEEDDGYIPKKINLSENKEVDIQKEICKFSESDDDQDITAEFSANDSDGEKDDIPDTTSESNKSVDAQNKLLVSDMQTNNKLNSQTKEKSPVNNAINEFSLVDKILLESKKCEEIINNSKNKTDIILSNKLSIDKSEKIINNSKVHNEKSHNHNKVKHKAERHDEIDVKSKTLVKKKSETDESLQKKNHSDSKLSKEKKSDKHVEKTVKLKTDKAQKLPVGEAKHKEKTKAHLSSKDSEVNSVGKSSNKKHAEDLKSRKDASNHKSPKRDRSTSMSNKDVLDDTKIKEIKTEKNSKKITEGSTKISKSESDSKGKEAKENSKASKSESKGKEIKGEKNSKKKLEESRSSKHAGKSKNSEKIESSHKKSKSKEMSKADKKESENEVDSCNLSNTDFDISDVVIDLDSDLDEHDTYEECWKIFNEENERKDSLSEEANLNKIRQIEESKVKDEEIVILGKKRVAHQPSLSRTVSNVSTTRLSPGQVLHNRYSKLQEMYRNTEKTEEKKANSAFLSRLTQFEVGKKRIAHVPNASLLAAAAERQKLLNKTLNVTASTSATMATTVAKGERIAHVPIMLKSKRPIIPAEYGSKVPCNIRQRYLENFIDECLKFCENEEQAFQLALEEEKNAYNRSSNKTVYLNVAVNTLKRLRNKRPIIDINSEDNLESKRSKLNDSNLNKTISHEYVLGGPKAAKTSFSIERRKVVKIDDDLKGKKLYNLLKPYIMTEKQLEENGFPRLDSANPGKAIIIHTYQKKPVCNNPLERICCRCQTKYRVTVKGKYVKEEECIYHWGRLWKRRIAGAIESRYSCCQGDSLSDGCCVAKGHVFENNETENLSGYVKTLIKSPPPDDNYGTYALDCEMCYSTAGVELTRITVIGPDLKPVYETLVKPEHEILDLNTRFSGINEGDLDKVSTTIEDVQAVLLSLFNSNTILIGHSLESDFKALKLIHSTVVDTSVVFPHKMGLPYKRALRTLMAEYLNKIIQNSVDGHDSQEDALACMELMLWKIKEDVKKSLR